MLPAGLTLLAFLALALQEPASPEARRAMGWDDFPVFVWRETHAGKPLPEALAEPFGGVILMRGEDSGWARERGLAYLVWNVAGRDALHLDADEAWNARVEQWIRTRDPKLLVREPCLNDPRTVEGLFTTLEATIAKHGEHPGLGFVLGDEVSLTPNGDPFDLCRCDFCEAQWKEYARKNGLPERAPLTDEVRLALLEDDFSLLGSWLARRRFDQQSLLQVLEDLATRARGDHERSVGLLGLKGRSAFGGVDALEATRFFDFLEGYPVGDTLPALSYPEIPMVHAAARRLAPAQDASLATLFLEEESPEGAAWLAWESWMRGADGLVLWSDKALLDEARRTRLAQAVRDIRALRARFPTSSRPVSSRVALLNDGDSIAASWMRECLLDGPTWPRRQQSASEASGARERRVRAWIRLADELGEPIRCTSLARIAAGSAPDFQVLVLPQVLCLDAADVTRLEELLDRGKTLVVDGDLAWIDRDGHPWKEDVLARLRRHAPEQVLVAPPQGEGLRAFAEPILAAPTLLYGLGPDASRGSWLSTRRVLPKRNCLLVPGSRSPSLLVLLPCARTSAERALLKPVALDPLGPEPIEWLHPPRGAPLDPGDAAVFLVGEGPRGPSNDPLPEPR